jgi:hypothetical protein
MYHHYPPVTIPCIAQLMNLQMLTVEVKPVPFTYNRGYWSCFLGMLESISSRHFHRATFVTGMPSKTIPAGDADEGWEHAESIVTQRAWAEGEPGVPKLRLHLRPRSESEEHATGELVRGLVEWSGDLVRNGWIGVYRI